MPARYENFVAKSIALFKIQNLHKIILLMEQIDSHAVEQYD